MIAELLYLEGCPGYERLLPTVRRLAREAGAEVQRSRIETPAAAAAAHFLGSPTSASMASTSTRKPGTVPTSA